jgi:DNA polymerase-3 subunit epsilon
VPFVLLDIETTGLTAAAGDRVCEIALMRCQAGEVTRRFETLVDPGRPISAGAFAVNGIDDEAVIGAPGFAAIVDQLLAELDGAVLVAHNVPFDVQFLDAELARLGRPPLPNIVLDTLTLARCYLTHDRYNLTALSRDLGFERPIHRAMSDVIALQALFEHLLARLRMLGVSTLAELVRAQRGLLPGEREPDTPPLIADASCKRFHLVWNFLNQGGSH